MFLEGSVTPPMVPPTTGPPGPSTANFVSIECPAGLSLAAMDDLAGISILLPWMVYPDYPQHHKLSPLATDGPPQIAIA